MWLTPIVHIDMWPTPKGFTRFNNLVHIAMWLRPKKWSCFSCERSLVNGSVTFTTVCILQIFYVYNALHGATLANCSHFQYVSRLRLRVIWIGVTACTDVTSYDGFFYHLHNREVFPWSSLRIFLTAVQWSTLRSKLYSFAKLDQGIQ